MAKQYSTPAIAQDSSTGADVYQRIKDGILSNLFPAGLNMHESELAEQYGTSRTPVREAVVRLQSEGLVEVLPRRGFRVVAVNAADMREIYDILMALETLAAVQLAEKRPTIRNLSHLIEAIELMEAALASADLELWASGDDRFHREILQLNANHRLCVITDSLYSQAHRTQKITLRMRDDLGGSNQEHKRIFDCIARGDAAGAGGNMRAHRKRGGNEIAQLLESYRLPPL